MDDTNRTRTAFVRESLATLAVLTVCIGVAACGDGPTEFPDIPDALGTYVGDWKLIRISFGPADTSIVKTCGGAFTVDEQESELFFGGYAMQSDTIVGCPELAGSYQGKFLGNGVMKVQVLTPDEIDVFVGCPNVILPGDAMLGSQRNDNFFLKRDDFLGSCRGGNQYVIIFEGQR